MTNDTKKDKIRLLVSDMLTESHEAMMKKIEKVLSSGAVDIDSWDEQYMPMILPKCIVIALMQDEATQYDGKGTTFEKQIKKEVRNIQYFL